MAQEQSDSSGANEGKTAEAGPAIVGIGASAGGIQALQSFFEALPEDTGAAYVVIVHLAPEMHSELPSILSTRTKMPVVQVGTPERLQANHVYVIPPGRRLDITDHEISTEEFVEPRGQRAPIDFFFRVLAATQGDGFAIILTGAGSDGAIGIRAVKEAGGTILVQDPMEADHPSMPRAAIATGVADVILPVRKLAVRFAELLKSKKIAEAVQDSAIDEERLRRILAVLHVRTGHDFSKYKRSTIVRRIARRMQVTRLEKLDDYYDLLRDEPNEGQALLGDLLISVTSFFRDAEAFEALKQRVVPALFESKDAIPAIRVWVPGCATGEEAYSLAILLIEEAERHPARAAIQIFASDLDSRALVVAREGRYPAAIEVDVSEERLRRFFTREGDYYRVRAELRDIVLFANHSLLKDPPFSRIDLISCRNLLIYLDRDLQQQACATFHYALNPGGYLLLGSSEAADQPPGLFRVMDRKARIYQSTAASAEKPRLLPRLLGLPGHHEPQHQLGPRTAPSIALSEAALHRQVLEKVAPPSVLVDATHRVLHLSENAGRYLQPAGGPLSGDVVDLVRSELRFELRSALNRVFEQRKAIFTLPIPVQFNGAPHRVYMLVKSLGDSEEAKPQNAVVMFLEGEPMEPAAAGGEEERNDATVRRLTEELQLMQARLRTTREESELANEELRAANEELQSMNEEYRSTSEELETSKEELQSINEELQTVNTELRLKLEAVSRSHSDLQNLMAATEIGALFLDASLKIKWFTEQVTALFRITQADEGRPIGDFTHVLNYGDLVKDAQAVLANLTPIRREASSQSGRTYDIRFRPYRTVEDRIDGVVITFFDVSELKHAEEQLGSSEALLRQEKRLVDMAREPIFIWDFDAGIVEWNRGCEQLYGYTRAEVLGKRKDKVLRTSVEGSSFDEVRKKVLADGGWSGELKHRSKDGRELTVESRIVLEAMEGRRLALESTHDVTERRLMEKRQELLLGELTHRVKNTLTVVQAIAHQTLRRGGSPEEMVKRLEGRLMALAEAHGLLVASNWKGADFAELARHQLAPYAQESAGRLLLEGKPVSLPADLATPFGLVLHELATNAAKYGSLSVPSGRVTVKWSEAARNKGSVLTVVWRETGGPAPKKPGQAGFGTLLIDGGIPQAKISRELAPEGLLCTIELPLPQAGQDDGVAR